MPSVVHAVTSNASSTYTYDNNGNLLTGDNFTNTWDYRNRLTQTQLSGTTTSYLYDINDERIALGANGATTTYPFKLYNINGNTIYKHIFANGEPVADIKGSTSTAAVYYIHDDHLGGSSVISDASANVAEVMEYYPFGGTRFDQRSGSFAEHRRSDGHEFDTGTGLLYEDARYLGPTLSRFLSEDPSFVSLSGSPDDLKDPQMLNAYSFAINNPISKTDPDGRVVYEATHELNNSNLLFFAVYDFLYVSTEHPDAIDYSLAPQLPQGTREFTTGGFPEESNPIKATGFTPMIVGYGYDNGFGQANRNTDWTAIQTNNLRGKPWPIDYKRAGYTSEEAMINAMLASARSLSGGTMYNVMGQTLLNGNQNNSNGFNISLLQRVGALSQIQGYYLNALGLRGAPAVISSGPSVSGAGGAYSNASTGGIINPFFVPPIGTRWTYANSTPVLVK